MNKKLTELVNFVLCTPPRMKDICYTDEAITTWRRDEILQKHNGIEVIYHCTGCGTKRHYNMYRGELREIKGETRQ